MDEIEQAARRVLSAALTAVGVTDHALRSQVAERASRVARNRPSSDSLSPEMAAFVDAVVNHSNDADVEALSQKGFSDDLIFELAVIASVSAGLVRMEFGLQALRAR